jgi:Rieske Fe-S protein
VSRKDFVRLCAGLGLGSAASPFLSACGGSTGGEPGGGRPLDGGPKVGEGGAIAEASGVEPGTAVPFVDASTGEQAVLLRLEGGQFAAYSAICTHQQCIVAYDGAEGTLECPCHGSIFDPANGAEVVSGPARKPLPEIPVRVEGGEVVRG